MDKIMIQRLFYFLFCLFHKSGRERAEYLKRHRIFKEIGDNCGFQPWFIPRDARCITLHNNIHIGSGITMACHDGIHNVLNGMPDEDGKQNEKLTRLWRDIEIFDNVQIGANVIICPGVKIGPNVVIVAGSVIINNIPPNSVVAGNPAKVVGRFDMMAKFRRKKRV